ncbi:MAG: acetylxylan esterase [Bryobacterales bacterium]|nr:acetylxylan esterase [Bryobacterales bacterium]
MSAAAEVPRVLSPAQRSQRRSELYSLMGDLPAWNRPVGVELRSREETPHYTLERLVLDLNGEEPVPAVFTKPKGASGRLPTILFNHSHGGGYNIGKKEYLEGRSYLSTPPYAEELANLGYAGLCFDTWAFGARAKRKESEIFKDMLWKGQVMWGMMVFDSLRAVEYLLDRPDVDAAKLGTLGISMGSTMAWWVAALDERIKVCVDICCLTDFDALAAENGFDRHGVYYYIPALRKYFTTAQINALIAPRAHLGLAGIRDNLTPVAGLDRIERELNEVYAAEGKPENWKLLRYDVGHQETPEGRAAIRQFLRTYLA